MERKTDIHDFRKWGMGSMIYKGGLSYRFDEIEVISLKKNEMISFKSQHKGNS